MLRGLKFLHDRKWAHRDIKSGNIMMDIEGRIKISTFRQFILSYHYVVSFSQVDFGLCADLSEGPVRKMLGSPFWIPPEMICKRPHYLVVSQS